MERDRLTVVGWCVVAYAFLAPLAFVALIGVAQHMGWSPAVTTREVLWAIVWPLVGVVSVVLLVRGVGDVSGRLRSLLVLWSLLPLMLTLASMCMTKS